MHVLSALIPSFVFALAVLEYPKLVAQGDKIGNWAGAERDLAPIDISKGLGPIRSSISITAHFNVPEIFDDSKPGQTVFIGITLGSTTSAGSRCGVPSLSVGVRIEITPERWVECRPVVQWFPGPLVPILLPNSYIHQNDEIRVTIITVNKKPSAAEIENRTQRWKLPINVPPPNRLQQGWGSCGWVAEFKVGLIGNRIYATNLPGFGTVNFHNMYIITGGADAPVPAASEAEFWGIWDDSKPTQRKQLVKADPVDGSSFKVEQLMRIG